MTASDVPEMSKSAPLLLSSGKKLGRSSRAEEKDASRRDKAKVIHIPKKEEESSSTQSSF